MQSCLLGVLHHAGASQASSQPHSNRYKRAHLFFACLLALPGAASSAAAPSVSCSRASISAACASTRSAVAPDAFSSISPAAFPDMDMV